MEFDGGRFRCDTLALNIDTTTFAVDSAVTATVAVSLGDVSSMGIPGHHTITASFTEPLDRFRGTR